MLGVVSSSPKSTLIRTMNKYFQANKDNYLFLHCAEDCTFRKPNPQVFDHAFKILRSLGIHENQTLYIGESLNDYYSATARGIPFVAVTTGFTNKDIFVKHGLYSTQILDFFIYLPSYLSGFRSQYQ